MIWNFNKIGVDRIVLDNIKIKNINMQKLLSKDNVRFITSSIFKRNYEFDGGVKEIGDIEIKDSMFYFRAGIKKDKLGIRNYENLNIAPTNILYGNNTRNANEPEQIIDALNHIKEIIYNDYGLLLDLSDATINKIEININIKLIDDFNSYKQVFKLIQKSIPKSFEVVAKYEGTGFLIKNRELEINFYDKGIKENILQDFSVLRIEYRLSSKQKVSREFGTINFDEFINNYEKIEKCFNKLTNKLIYKPIKNKINDMLEDNWNRLSYIRNSHNHYIQKFCAVTQDYTIFDYEIISAAINKLDINRGNKFKRKREVIRAKRKREIRRIIIFS